jgi:hypothetical protein
MTELTRKPTHRCTRCSALWTLWPDDKGWSLFSRHCGPCCDNVEMGAQIEALPVTGTATPLHPSLSGLLQFFEFSHLPAHLAAVSWPFAELAWRVANGPQNPETTTAIRKLLEAKDCAVRAVVGKF